MLYPEKNAFNLASKSNIDMFDKALGSTQLRMKISESNNYNKIKQSVDKDVQQFISRKKVYQLYD